MRYFCAHFYERKGDTMATAKKLPSGSYRCLVYEKTVNGKRRYKSFTAQTKKEAEYLAAKYMSSIDERKNDENNNLFSKELSRYISKKENVLSPSTIKGYKNIERMLNKNFHDFYYIKISKITNDDVQDVVNKLTKDKSPKTVRM